MESAIDVFDLATNRWSTLPDSLPTPRAGVAVVVVDEDVVVIDGESDAQERAFSSVEVLNTKDGTWRAWPSLLEGRHGTGVALIDNTIYVARGSSNRNGHPESRTVERLKLGTLRDR